MKIRVALHSLVRFGVPLVVFCTAAAVTVMFWLQQQRMSRIAREDAFRTGTLLLAGRLRSALKLPLADLGILASGMGSKHDRASFRLAAASVLTRTENGGLSSVSYAPLIKHSGRKPFELQLGKNIVSYKDECLRYQAGNPLVPAAVAGSESSVTVASFTPVTESPPLRRVQMAQSATSSVRSTSFGARAPSSTIQGNVTASVSVTASVTSTVSATITQTMTPAPSMVPIPLESSRCLQQSPFKALYAPLDTLAMVQDMNGTSTVKRIPNSSGDDDLLAILGLDFLSSPVRSKAAQAAAFYNKVILTPPLEIRPGAFSAVVPVLNYSGITGSDEFSFYLDGATIQSEGAKWDEIENYLTFSRYTEERLDLWGALTDQDLALESNTSNGAYRRVSGTAAVPLRIPFVTGLVVADIDAARVLSVAVRGLQDTHINSFVVEDITEQTFFRPSLWKSASNPSEPDEPYNSQLIRLLNADTDIRTSDTEFGRGGHYLSGLRITDTAGKLAYLNKAEATSMLQAVDQSNTALRASFMFNAYGRIWSVHTASDLHYLTESLDDILRGLTTTLAGFGGGVICAVITSLLLRRLYRSHRAKERQQRENLVAVKAASLAHEQTLAFAAHELRNPLHLISGTLELLYGEAVQYHPVLVADLETLRQATENMHRLINDLLDYNLLRRGKLSITPAPLVVRSFIDKLCKAHQHMANVPIEWEVGACVPDEIIADGLRLGQVLANGLTNAVKFVNGLNPVDSPVNSRSRDGLITVRVYCDEGPLADSDAATTIDIKTQCNQRYLLLEVRDTGPGPQNHALDAFSSIPTPRSTVGAKSTPGLRQGPVKQLRQHQTVYQKPLDSTGNSFWQPSTTARVKGSGIGLSVSKLLSVQLGGSLRLYRDNLADETVYALRIPLDIPTAKEASTPTGQECRVRMDHLASASHQEQHSPRIVAQPIVEHATTFNAVNQITEMQPKNRPDDVFPDQTDLPALSVSNDVNTLMTSKPFQRRADLRIIPPTSATEPATASSAACLIPLPVLDTQVLAVNTTNRLEETTPSPHPLNIIYADDELSNRKLFIRMLSKLGHNVVRVVDDGDSLLQALGYSITTATTSPLGDTAKTEISPQTVSLMPPTTSALPPVDVIFSDIVMQRIEGTEACRALRAAGCNIPIFAATGNANSWELLREVGFTGILPKPFTIHSIQACLDAIKPSSTNHS